MTPAPLTYFVQAIDGGPIKIGRTTRKGLASRLCDLQVGNPLPLRITRKMNGNHEGELHWRFQDYRLNGEWFMAVPEVATVARAIPDRDSGTEQLARAWFDSGYRAGWADHAEHRCQLAENLRRKFAEASEDIAELEDSVPGFMVTEAFVRHRREMNRAMAEGEAG